MEDLNKVELLQEIIGSSKEFKFETDEIMNIRKYYDTKQSININFVALMEIMFEKLDDEDINRILFNVLSSNLCITQEHSTEAEQPQSEPPA